jgi:hypothetical protein
MSQTHSQPLILTLKLDHTSFTTFDRLRKQHFPPERNVIPAHITLFHTLPASEEGQLLSALQEVSAQTPILDLHFPGVQFLGGGVAIEVESPGLLSVRKRLASTWAPWLSAQDQAGYRPHITIQNKVSAREARQLYVDLRTSWQPFSGTGEGLLLWAYLGGPWELITTFSFLEKLA